MPVPKDLTSGFLPEIFEKQTATMEKFHHIEKANGGLQTEDVPVDLDSFPGQARLRDFGWRITEELIEALLAYRDLDYLENSLMTLSGEPIDLCQRKVELWSKTKEELMDCLHFIVEFSILCGFDFYGKLNTMDVLNHHLSSSYPQRVGSFDQGILLVIEKLGVALNILRNRAWKQTARPTDYKSFYASTQMMWSSFLDLLKFMGFTPRSVFIGYCGKNEINKQRQESGV